MSGVYDSIIGYLNEGVEKPGKPKQQAEVSKGRRPLKMPKSYDFSVRNVNWADYSKDFLLRTDAIWERNKLFDIFYSEYKARFLYDNVNNRYMIANIRNMPLPTNEPEHLEDFRPFMGYTDHDGCIW